jgi:hypothetical protein
MPIFPKRRFQDGVAADDARRSTLGGDEQEYRRRFFAMYAG